MFDVRRSALRWAATALLLTAGAALAQAPSAPARDAASAAADRPGPGEGAGLRDPAAPTSRNPRSPPPALTASDLAALPGLEGLRGGGDAAPLCRARCAPAFYTCVSAGADDGGCHAALAVCRRGCDADSPPPGRMQSPLPAAGLAPAGALRPLPGGLPAVQ